MSAQDHGLPEGWSRKSIGDLVVRTKQRNPSAKPNERFTYIDVSAISNTSFRITEPAELLGSEAPSRARKLIQKDDILFATVRPTLKRVALVPSRFHDQIASTGYAVLRANRDKVAPGFLYFQLLTDSFIARMGELQRGASYPAVRDTDILNESIPVPPLPEQQKIAAVLGVVQRAIEQQEQLLALTAELKKTLLHQLFTQGLRHEPQKQTDIGPVPESWEVAPIASLGKVVTGSTPKTKVPEFYAPHEADFIAPADLGNTKGVYESEKKISHAGLATIRPLPAKAVMCVCIGSSIGKVGMTTKPKSATNQQLNSIICHDRHDPDFVFYLLRYLCTYWRGFATFGPVPILSKGAFEVIKIATPPTREEEQEIATILSACDAKMEAHQRKHTTLTALFRTLLHQLMTAQIRVDEKEFPHACELAEISHDE